MKAISTLTLTNVGATHKLERGRVTVEKGKALRGLFLKCNISLANASGGAVAMTDTQRQSFLGGYRMSLTYGKNNKRKPYNSILLTRLQRISRFLNGQDWEGYTNSTNGLATSMPNSATTALVFWAYVPTSYIWHNQTARKLLAVGRTQAKTFELEVKRESDTLPSGVTVSGNVTFTIYPHVESNPNDPWLPLAEWIEVDETDKTTRGPNGLTIYAAEDAAVLASSSLTNIEVRVGKEVVYTGISPADGFKPYLQIPNIDSEGSLDDRETVLYQWTPNSQLGQLPAGRVEVEQITKDLATFSMGTLTFPLLPSDEIREEVEWAAGKQGRNKPLKAVNAAVALGYELPESHHPYVGWILYDAEDPQFARFAGLGSGHEQDPAQPYVPESVIANARELIAQYTLKGEAQNAEEVIRRVALAAPDAVQDVEGFAKRGSVTLDQVRVLITH